MHDFLIEQPEKPISIRIRPNEVVYRLEYDPLDLFSIMIAEFVAEHAIHIVAVEEEHILEIEKRVSESLSDFVSLLSFGCFTHLLANALIAGERAEKRSVVWCKNATLALGIGIDDRLFERVVVDFVIAHTNASHYTYKNINDAGGVIT